MLKLNKVIKKLRAIITGEKIIQLREEKLNISKRKKKTGEVNFYKKTINDTKSIVVPIVREELIVEKKIFDEDSSKNEIETISIPISEEQVEIKKHLKATRKINIYKKQFEENESIEVNLKKEKESIKFNEPKPPK